jgi:dienelactone hydrolase
MAMTLHAAPSDARPAKSYTFPPVAELPAHSGMPDPFVKPDGTRLTTRAEWPVQRHYLKAMMAYYQYGERPPLARDFGLEKLESESAFAGKGVQERYAISLTRKGKKATIRFELVRPSKSGRVPVIVKNAWALFASNRYDRAAAEEAVKRGYLLCLFMRTDIADDKANNRNKGVLALYPDYDWGTIAAWAWGHSLAIDALDRLKLVDMDRIVVTGHSRGGKTALCAGVYDERIAITAPNSSGTGGTGSLRYFEEGQKPQRLILHKKQFPHWWHERFFQFGGKEERLPYDAHTAKALIAPRAMFNAHARQDYWANPYGTELTYRAANEVFDWLDAKGKQGISWRDGGHAQKEEDWLALLDFADWIFYQKKSKRRFDTLVYPNAELPVDWEAP